jgi:hypothetical protein
MYGTDVKIDKYKIDTKGLCNNETFLAIQNDALFWWFLFGL